MNATNNAKITIGILNGAVSNKTIHPSMAVMMETRIPDPLISKTIAPKIINKPGIEIIIAVTKARNPMMRIPRIFRMTKVMTPITNSPNNIAMALIKKTSLTLLNALD